MSFPFDSLRRAPDVEGPGLVASDAADRLILDESREAREPAGDGAITVIGDAYGALALGAAWDGARGLRVHQDALAGERAIVANAARLGLDYKHSFTELAYFQQTGEYLPNLSDSEAYLMNTESALVAPLSRRLGLKLSYVVRYNNAPPVRENVRLKTTDTFFSSGITVSF